MVFEAAPIILLARCLVFRRKHVIPQAITYGLQCRHHEQIRLVVQIPSCAHECRPFTATVVDPQVISGDVETEKVLGDLRVCAIVRDPGQTITNQILRVDLATEITEAMNPVFGIFAATASV